MQKSSKAPDAVGDKLFRAGAGRWGLFSSGEMPTRPMLGLERQASNTMYGAIYRSMCSAACRVAWRAAQRVSPGFTHVEGVVEHERAAYSRAHAWLYGAFARQDALQHSDESELNFTASLTTNRPSTQHTDDAFHSSHRSHRPVSVVARVYHVLRTGSSARTTSRAGARR